LRNVVFLFFLVHLESSQPQSHLTIGLRRHVEVVEPGRIVGRECLCSNE
jgi:hypothetical protein